ncbi:MAG TPA: hypothetical protein VK348_01845, partial [Planctomycetota bacterium]|nr:hypothetical protein [Planctomycetota bacterium]
MLASPSLAQICSRFANSPPGTNLGLTDDSGRVVQLPFAFPFNGGTITSIGICSNGYVWLGAPPATNPWDFTDSEAEMLSQPARIAVCWDDWNPGLAAAGNGVFFHATATQANIVWKGVPRFASTTVFANMELVLDSSGLIHLSYDASMSAPNDACITGVSTGGGAVANAISWTPLPGVVGNTAYQLFTPLAFNLAGTSMGLVPASPTTYATASLPLGTCAPGNYAPIASTAVYGSGCPRPNGTWYEQFASGSIDLSGLSIQFTRLGPLTYLVVPGPGLDTSYTPADILTQTDDSQVTVPVGPMGSFPFAGLSVASIAADSNGYLWMAPSTVNDFTPSSAEFATQGPRIAPLWHDWNFVLGGTFYWTTTAGSCMGTWENVAAYGVPGSQNTFQVKLLANGDIVFNYGTVLNNSTNGGIAIVGLSPGATGDAGSNDLGAAMAPPTLIDLTTLIATPLTHSGTTVPAFGSAYIVAINNIPAGSAIGAFIYSFTQVNVDL